MKIDEAVSVLRAYSAWRRSPAYLPEDAMIATGDILKIGVAIDTVCNALEKIQGVAGGLLALLDERDALREALKVLVNWTPSADTYRRLGFDPEAPMRAHEAAKAALAKGKSDA